MMPNQSSEPGVRDPAGADGVRPAFDYAAAFSRNIGWVTPREQQALAGKRVAIAGLGGVGGSHLLTLARLGIGAFTIADYDRFDLVNFNRQAGAFVSTIGERKSDVMASACRDVNPDVRLTVFDDAIDARNVDEFLDGADVYVDGKEYDCPAPCLGVSQMTGDTVWQDLRQKYPATITVAVGGASIYLTFGVIMGVVAADEGVWPLPRPRCSVSTL